MDSDASATRITSVEEEHLFPLRTHQEEDRGIVNDGDEPSSNPVFSVPDQDRPKPPSLPVFSPVPDQEMSFLGYSASGSSGVVEKIETLCLEPRDNGISEVDFVSNGGGSSTKGENLLEAKKKQLLMELECGSLLKEKTCEGVEDVLDVGGGILGCSLKIEVIDDTALVIPAGMLKSGNGGGVAKSPGSKKKEKMCENGENDGKKAKLCRQRKRHHTREPVVIGLEKKDCCIGGAGKLEDDVKVKYSRDEMERLKFVNVVDQRKMWKGIYTGLEASVRKGYDDLASAKHQKQKTNSNSEPRRQHQRPKDAGPGIIGEVSSEYGDSELSVEQGDVSNANNVDDYWSLDIGGEDAYKGSGEELTEEEDSDEDYASIQRPAFYVEGEPDFDSGPPEDGLEYLRRVRWEAARVPKVKVAKLDRSKVSEVQSFYMPQIPDIPKCPEHLLPLKQWEDAFLVDFSNLRQALSREEEVSIIEETDVGNAGPLQSHEDNSSSTPRVRTPRESLNVATTSSYPMLSAVMAMDSVARISMLKNRIAHAESMNSLSKDDCVWLFALCAAVDTPLHADTCAAIRSLLRKCATLRAEKSELDDEVVMLNILATIAGRYFGQAGS